MHPRRWLLAAAVLTLCAPGARAQTTSATISVPVQLRPALARSAPPTSSELPADVFAPAPGAARTGGAEAQSAENRKAQHLQKIQQLSFDRRPSEILKTWSTPPDTAADKKKEDATASAAAAAATAASASARVRAAGSPDSPTPATPDAFDTELKTFQRLVTLGDWPAVKLLLAKLPQDEGKALHKRLVEALPNTPFDMGGRGANMAQNALMMQQAAMQQFPQMAGFFEKNAVSSADVIAIALATPHGLDRDLIEGLGRLLRAALDQGNAIEDFLAQINRELATAAAGKPGALPLSRRDTARLLIAAGCAVEAGGFLPTPEKAEADNDREALNLLSRHNLALYAKEKKVVYLERAWAVTQAVLAAGQVDRQEKEEALTRAVDLAVQVRAELGRAWLEESFTRRPERGMEVIAAVGAASARGLRTHPSDPDFRKKSLDLQKTAVEALIKASPDRASNWATQLGLLASAWLAEADFSRQFDESTSLGPHMRRDAYGNLYYVNDDGMMMNAMRGQPNMPRAVRVADVLDARPDTAWLDRLDPAIRPKFAATYSQLYLKVGEDERAFPYIEQLAATHPEKATELAEEFVRVWTRNHDPNAERNRTNIYMYMYGFERKAESIPLTRSKQERNLKELTTWVKRLRALPIGRLDEKLLARAFTTCHSAAEVYRVEAIESVFGSLDRLKPETLAELVQQMRGNLAGLWRQPAVQEQNKTKRREKDIQAEVLRGYDVAAAVVASGLKKYPGHWTLELAGAAVAHDENAYRQELDPSLRFTKTRSAALERFRHAAALYAAKVPSLSEEDESDQAFEQWFYASLGACDLAAIDEKSVPDTHQPALIRKAILDLPGAAAERHLSRFANALFTRMSGLNPAVKFRYLRGGFEIVGEHKQAIEAKKVYDYYKDLVTEIRLEAAVDGATAVGHDRPFGVFVNLRHTREIERESGGFGRYLQNQNNPNSGFSYNYGRPLENYRDKFQEAATRALQEQFQVLSVTFQDEKVNSRAAAEYGWRITPYAYLLLKARSPEVDKIPPLRLDLDFLDTSGYVILPAESPVVPIDAAPAAPPVRPFEKLKVTQTLDERQAASGKLILEVKTVARGLTPELDQILDVGSPGFHVVKTDDQGLSVSHFDPEGVESAVLSERAWLVTLQADDGLPQLPTSFHFPTPKVTGAEVIHQRYVDADLAQVPAVVPLDERYGKPDRSWIAWTTVAVVVALVAAIGLILAFRRRAPRVRVERFRMPEPLTAFTVLALLRDIQSNNGLSEAGQRELTESIDRLERRYFAGDGSEESDLHTLATTWISRSQR